MWHVLTSLLIAVILAGCSEQGPIKIGFIGSLSGRAAAVSQASRDGVILAIEDVNQAGGINGRQLELITYDDHHDKDKVTAGINFLADSGAVAIIGPITSQMAIAAVPVANQRKVPLISPTTSTVDLSDIKDHFFRTISACSINARNLATFAREELNVHRLAVLKDLSNIAFTEPWQHCFKEQFIKLGGEVVSEVDYTSLKKDHSFHDLAEKIIASRPDAILILSSSIDAAIFSQQVYKYKKGIQLLGSDWSFTGDLIRYGGKTVEGFIFTTNLNLADSSPTFKNYKERFVIRFNMEPKFPSTLAYEATSVLINALKKNPRIENLDLTLNETGKIQGLQGTITLNQYGDIIRPTYINKVQDGDFVFIKEKL